MIKQNKEWAIAATVGLSLVNFLEQNLDDKELAVVIDGWLAWAGANIPPAFEDVKDAAITDVLNNYTQKALKEGGARAKAQIRVIDVFYSRLVNE